jgi:hypothetical protein
MAREILAGGQSKAAESGAVAELGDSAGSGAAWV